jgi:TonB family protein
MRNEPNDKKKRRTAGIVASLLFHSFLFLVLWIATVSSTSAPSYNELLISFEEAPKEVAQINVTNTPPEAVKDKEVSRVEEKLKAAKVPNPTKDKSTPKASSAPEIAKNTTPLTAPTEGSTFGDVDRHDPAPDTTPKIKTAALFNPSVVNDGEAPKSGVTAAAITNVLSVGVATGSAKGKSTGSIQGNDLGAPSIDLEGRDVVGKIPEPNYSRNLQGKIIIRIGVDGTGKVTSATFQSQGSTSPDGTLQRAAIEAAKKTKFTTSPNLMQYGTITYVFKLK